MWSGSTALKNDRRSMALAEMLPLLRDWAEWVSLQKEVHDADIALLASRADIREVGAELSDFAETAAVVELMDVVVTVDTSVANLAGAMGKTVWISAVQPSRLALDAGSRGQRVVPDCTPVSPTRDGGLGYRHSSGERGTRKAVRGRLLKDRVYLREWS